MKKFQKFLFIISAGPLKFLDLLFILLCLVYVCPYKCSFAPPPVLKIFMPTRVCFLVAALFSCNMPKMDYFASKSLKSPTARGSTSRPIFKFND